MLADQLRVLLDSSHYYTTRRGALALFWRALPDAMQGLFARVLRPCVFNEAPVRFRRFGVARWQSGYAADCKSVDIGSIPVRASMIHPKYLLRVICLN